MLVFLPSFLMCHIRKTWKCHRGAWMAGWEFPNVTRQELKVRKMAIFILTSHVRKTGKCHRGACKAGWPFPESKGFSTTNLWYMKKWYEFYSTKEALEILHQLGGELQSFDSQAETTIQQLVETRTGCGRIWKHRLPATKILQRRWWNLRKIVNVNANLIKFPWMPKSLKNYPLQTKGVGGSVHGLVVAVAMPVHSVSILFRQGCRRHLQGSLPSRILQRRSWFGLPR